MRSRSLRRNTSSRRYESIEQTKDLVAEALSENKQMRKLLSELDRTPRDSEDFADRVTELRRVFQLHVRDERRSCCQRSSKHSATRKLKRSSRASKIERLRSRRKSGLKPTSDGPLLVRSVSRRRA